MAKRNHSFPDTLFKFLDKNYNGHVTVDAFSLSSLVGVEVFTLGTRVTVASMDEYFRYVDRIRREDLIGNLLDLNEVKLAEHV